MRYRAPKGITNHPGVESCEDGDAEGFDYKHHVWLKPGWAFKRGRMAGCRTGNFHRVEDFVHAEPVQEQVLEQVAPGVYVDWDDD